MRSPFFCSLESRAINNGSLYGRFLLGPIPIDLSLTVATTLRRGLLHSQPNFGIVSAKIEGAVHEYAALPGVQESVLELLLNLGEVVLTTTHRNLLQPSFRNKRLFLHHKSGIYIAFIRTSGPGIIRAKDINWPDGIYCVNPDAHIATLSNNATLNMQIKIMATDSSATFNSFSPLESDPFANSLPFASSACLAEQAPKGQEAKQAKEKEEKTGSLPLRSKQGPRMEPISKAPLAKTESHFNSVLGTEQKKIDFDKKSETLFAESESSNLNLPTKRSKLKDAFQTKTQNKRIIPRGGLYVPDLTVYSKIEEQETRSNNKALSEQRLSFSEKEEQDLEVSQLNDLTNQANQSILEKEQNVLITEPSHKNFFVETEEKQERLIELSVSPCSYPVQKVNFVIERDDQWVGYRHRIILEVWTNGSISPRQAIFDSVDWMYKLMYTFREPTRGV